MKELEKKHTLASRWFHWINFPLLTLMIISGTLIYWAYPIYRIGLGHFTLVKLNLPQPIWQKLHANSRLAMGMAWHFFFMWLFAINGVAYVLYTLISGEWRELTPDRHAFREAIQVTLHDLHLREEKPPQSGRYNAAQRIAYTAIVVMGVGSLISGLAIYKPVQFAWLAALMGGYTGARFVHFWLTVGYLVFFVVHVGQVVKTGWNNFRSMIIGYELVEREKPVVTDGGQGEGELI